MQEAQPKNLETSAAYIEWRDRQVYVFFTLLVVSIFMAAFVLSNRGSRAKSYDGPLSISRAQAANMAVASFIHFNGGRVAANEVWQGRTNQQRYRLIALYLGFAPERIEDYMEDGHSLTLPEALLSVRPPFDLKKAKLVGPDGNVIDY